MTAQLCVTLNVVLLKSGKIVITMFVLRMGPIEYLSLASLISMHLGNISETVMSKPDLTLCLLGNFAFFLSSADFFLQNQLFEKLFQEYHQRFVIRLDPDQARRRVCSGTELFAKVNSA